MLCRVGPQHIQGLAVAIDNGLGGNHLHTDESGTLLMAQQAEREIRHPRHGAQQQIVCEGDIPDPERMYGFRHLHPLSAGQRYPVSE